ncbi:chymotrypsin-C-like [Leptopilina boulardi]|uniref:chymotrypsin-C-like n=1 Tax=Leptopilina boulardi TaxID=63433 RepID=UPI0021F5A110|nr:chymotrypsin-C-like [Leptopilina boulardi]
MIYTLLGGIFLCFICNISANNFKECKPEKCVLLEKCNKTVDIINRIKKTQYRDRTLFDKLKNLQCDYNQIKRKPYFCCEDEENKETDNVPQNISNHPNLKLFGKTQFECGSIRYNPQSLNSNYNEAKEDESPWTALIQFKNRTVCSGTLINNRYVLTAAHCIKPFLLYLKNIKIILGDYNIMTNPDCKTQWWNKKTICNEIEVVGIDTIHAHPKYSKKDITNDIALIRLDRYIEFSDTIDQICLPFDNEVSINNYPYDLYGRGISMRNSAETKIPIKTMVQVIENSECESLYKLYNWPRKIDDTMVCVKHLKTPRTCIPDDGGDLSAHDQHLSQKYQFGIGSFNWSRCTLNLPFVYTKIFHYLKWILDTVRA